MSPVERIVAETKDALIYGRTVKCACGREGFIRHHGKGVRWLSKPMTTDREAIRAAWSGAEIIPDDVVRSLEGDKKHDR